VSVTNPYDAARETGGGGSVEVAAVDQPAGAPTGETVHGLGVLEDDDHPLVPTVAHEYVAREVRDGRTDLDLAGSFLADDEYGLLLVGETGVGKDQLVRYLCAETNRPVVRVNFGSGTTYADLVGDYAPNDAADRERLERARRLVTEQDAPSGTDAAETPERITTREAVQLVGAEDAFRFRPGVLYQAVKYGWTFVADELNAAGPAATMPLHGLTERDGQLVVKPTAEVLDPHPEFRFVATMNPPRYAGTSPLNDAFRSRFWELRLDYLPPEAERRLLFSATPLSPEATADRRLAERLTDLAATLRESYRNRDLSTPTSHRAVLKVGRLVAEFGMAPEPATKQVLHTRASPEDRNAVAKAIESVRW
jgi:MoxR-like ATPase